MALADLPTPANEAWLFRVLMENITDHIYFKDLQSRFIAVSRAQAELFGLRDPAGVVGKSDFQFFSREHAQQAYDDEQEIILSGAPIVSKEEMETWSGRPNSWVSTTKMPLRDAQGNAIGTFGISRDITEQKLAQEKLQKSESMLRQHVQRMQQELKRAQSVQKALLPARPPANERFLIDFRYEAMEAVGGDYISFYPFADGSVGIFIADVAGHGVSAALFVVLLKFLTDRLATEAIGRDPAAFLNALNEQMANEIQAAFVTALYSHFRSDPSTKRMLMTYASAGHPSPIIIRNADQHAQRLDAPRAAAMGIGVPITATASEIPLEKGDRVILYTDGFSEARNPLGEVIGMQELLKRLQSTQRDALSTALDRIMSGVREYSGSAELADDIVLCGVDVK